jgi:aspartate/tyrosine/aromatic aminotransferase
VSSPTWGNHNAVFAVCGLTVRTYRYFDKKTKGLDFEGMIEDL